ncbi:MAG: hypothetical protein MJZ37_04920 [Bacilli bacterium]|nr:hypothetical protein [Bacilli bacterium]
MKNKTIPFLFSLFLLASCGGTKPCEEHTFGDFVVTKEASCGVAGSKERTCTVCGEKETEEIKALTHKFQDDTDQTGAVKATCQQAGKVITKCKNCGEKSSRDVPQKTTHDLGEYTVVTSATHFVEGSKKATCKDCGAEDVQVIARGDHNFGDTAAATVAADHDLIGYDVFSCADDNAKKIVWDAKDVTLDTKEVLYNEEANYTVSGEGVKFGGRPIGNAMTLPASSSAHEAVFDANVPGAFLEYKINVKASMVGAQLSAEFTPANYLDGTAGLFLGAAAGSDWTPGLIADDSDAGYKISEFRFIVLVNGKAVEMDASKNIAGDAVNGRGWYNFPCTVDLKAGINTIKIVEAGGWEPTFYNFAVTSASAVEDVVPAASEGYTVQVSGDEHVTSIKFYEDERFTIEDTADVHYSRTEQGRKSQEGDGQCNMAITVAEGYKVKGIEQVSPATKAYKNFKFPIETSADSGREDSYKITKIEDNIVVKVITEPVNTVKEGYQVTFVKGEHVVSIELYNDAECTEANKVTGLVGTSIHKSSGEPTKEVDMGQLYCKIVFEEGYKLDATNTKTGSGTTCTFNKIEENPAGSGKYKLTKVNSDGTITIVAVAA